MTIATMPLKIGPTRAPPWLHRRKIGKRRAIRILVIHGAYLGRPAFRPACRQDFAASKLRIHMLGVAFGGRGAHDQREHEPCQEPPDGVFDDLSQREVGRKPIPVPVRHKRHQGSQNTHERYTPTGGTDKAWAKLGHENCRQERADNVCSELDRQRLAERWIASGG